MKAMSAYTVRENGNRTLEEATSEIQRELDVRRRLYDRWISEGRISRVDAHDRLERMLAALMYLLAYTPAQGEEIQAARAAIEHTVKVLDPVTDPDA